MEDSGEILHLFGDATRMRLLRLLAQRELTVSELTRTTQLSQSRVSTHLGRLKEAGVIHDRRQGTSIFYRLHLSAMPESHRQVWSWLDGQLQDDVLRSDAARLESLLLARDGGAWPDSIAGEMERHYSPGRTWESMAHGLSALLELGRVLDIGCGDGAVASLTTPRARELVCFDRSPKLLSAARRRLGAAPHIRYSSGDMHALPFCTGAFDHILMFNVLTYAHEPARALAEAARVLRKGGSLSLLTINHHSHLSETAAYGHIQPGFAPDALQSLLRDAGLSVLQCGVRSREKRSPHFEVVGALARRCGETDHG